MKHCCSLFLFLLPCHLLCQTISGKIEEINGEKVLFANVVTKDSLGSLTVKEFTIAKNGFYSITLSKQYQAVVVEVSAPKFQKEVFVIERFNPATNYIQNFFLVKDTIVKLQDVVVTAKARPFHIQGDTVSYNVDAYRDGTERKIQDVIKKLPGVELNEKTGEIKYKGKPVETVKLDGDDLFASNYAIGTKNINVNMVEQVQAIENYSDNPLLSGIESGDKVALNLTLKKKKTDYSGSVDAGTGVLGSNAAIDASTDLLGISKKYKSFATISFNNIGINKAPFDYFSYNPNAEQLKEADFLAKQYIPDTYFNTEIDGERSNINRSFFSSYNAAFKLGQKLSLKTNLYYLNDKIRSKQSYVVQNNINGQNFTTSDVYEIVKKPLQYRGDADVKYTLSKRSLLEYSVQYKIENINTLTDIVQNSITNFNASLNTRNNYFRQLLTYTSKLSDKKVVQLIIRHTFNSLPQDYAFLPAVYQPSIFSSNNQSSGFQKSNLNAEANFLGSVSKGKYIITLGTKLGKINFRSALNGYLNNDEVPVIGFNNDFKYTQQTIYAKSSYKLQFRRFKLTPSVNLTYLQQYLPGNSVRQVDDTVSFLLEPALTVGYRFDSYSSLLLTTAYRQKPFSEENFIANPVYISSRIIRSNEFSLQIQQSKTASFFYLINNLYRQFQLNIGAVYSENKGDYFTNLLVQPTYTKVVHFFLPELNKLLSLNFMTEKYLPLLQSTLRFRSDYSLQLYKNIINNSSLRNNAAQSLSNELFFKTAFDAKINIENTFWYRILSSKAKAGISFSNRAIKNNFQIIAKPLKKLFFLISTDYFLPDTKKSEQKFFFLDASLFFQTKNKIYDLRFAAKNITNNKNLLQFDADDFSTIKFQTNLLPAHFIVSVSRNF